MPSEEILGLLVNFEEEFAIPPKNALRDDDFIDALCCHEQESLLGLIFLTEKLDIENIAILTEIQFLALGKARFLVIKELYLRVVPD